MSADKDSGMNFSYEEYEALLEKGKFEEATAYKARFLPDVLYKFVPLYDVNSSIALLFHSGIVFSSAVNSDPI